ncbi:MAG: response regulator transcription factor [Bacilli bacterium]
MAAILIVEDDADIAFLEKEYLALSGFTVEIEGDGKKGLEKILKNKYDLVLLDVMLPSMNGFEICRRIRNVVDIPVLMVTARVTDLDKIQGLSLGADDYIEKPFSPSVLVAKVKARLSQYKRLKKDGEEEEEVVLGDIRINSRTHTVYKGSEEVSLKNKEFELLVFLARHTPNVYSKDDLYEKIWGMEALGDSATVTVHINRLREKLEDDPSNPRHILTLWGTGYCMK